jgi:hypothetical protein
MSAAQADHARSRFGLSAGQMMTQLEPFIAADQRVDQIQTQHGQFNPSSL